MPTLERTRRVSAWGPRLLENGQFRFALWAPDAEQVTLVLDRGARRLPMQAEPASDTRPKGWFSVETDEAAWGCHYQFQINNDLAVPDPASRYQPEDVHGPSQLLNPQAYQWQHPDWQGRPWEEAVIYELHVGTFTPQGTFKAIINELPRLKALGVTAIQLMPVSDFPGQRNWGYDGVLPYAPDAAYGQPDELKALIDAAHGEGLMVFLDVVYNHFGPEGNYLHAYAKPVFAGKKQTPWGGAINFEGLNGQPMRDFVISNVLYWLQEFRFDGLRFDAVHAIYDGSLPPILEELAATVKEQLGPDRQVHLILENEDNRASLLKQAIDDPLFTAQWNDDMHHGLHTLLTQEAQGYYAPYADDPIAFLQRSLTQGFAFQGEFNPYTEKHRGEASGQLPLTAFVNFLQNHDQVGNRAFGERITSLAEQRPIEIAAAIYLLAPSIPMLFMGEEWGSRQPFPFFCDFGPELAEAVTKGRRKEFAKFPAFQDPAQRERIPDPNSEQTFQLAKLDSTQALQSPSARQWHDGYTELLRLRHQHIVPLLLACGQQGGAITRSTQRLSPNAFMVRWQFAEKALELWVNMGTEALACPDHVAQAAASALYRIGEVSAEPEARLETQSLLWLLQ